jgi:hypothetical protein
LKLPSRIDGLWLARQCIRAHAGFGVALALYFVLLPGVIVVGDVARLPSGPEIPPVAWRLERTFSPRYEKWARTRLASGRAASLTTRDIAGTEWPLFGSVFYLWALEALQDAWQQDHSLAPQAPAWAARGAIEAAASLVIDPGQASWVKKHWGPQYLEREDVFYRMMLISALVSHHELTGSDEHAALLRTQIDTLADEIARSPYGLLDDYPGQCFPTDVLSAIASIRRADRVLGTDHAAFSAQARRAFQGCWLDEAGLVPYAAESRLQCGAGVSRGSSNSFASLRAPFLWPDLAATWYERYRANFWGERDGMAGFREFRAGSMASDWYFDVDSGPVVAGLGMAATAFGTGAARVNGHLDDARPLTLEMLALSWPLMNGTLVMPRAFSNAVDAPYLGEAAILYILTRTPAPATTIHAGGSAPAIVYAATSLYFAAGLFLVMVALLQARDRLRQISRQSPRRPRLQIATWVALLGGGLVSFATGHIAVMLAFYLFMGFLPRAARL